MIKIKGARVVKGAGRGKKLGMPTINLGTSAVGDLEEGIYVCRAYLPDPYWGVMHFGPRPVFGETKITWEVMLFDFEDAVEVPGAIDVEIHNYIREVMDFKTPKQMIVGVNKDVLIAKKLIMNL